MPFTHFISRPDLPLLHQRLETEPGYFCICLVVPNLCLRHFGAGGGGCENLPLGVVHNGYLNPIFFSLHLSRDLYKGSYLDQL